MIRKKCGKCCKNYGTLIPVVATSRGLVSDSYAHLECLDAWQMIANVEVDETRKAYTHVNPKRVYRKAKIIAPMPSYPLNVDMWRIANRKYYTSELSDSRL